MDYAHEWTDKRIERLEKRIRKEYRVAAREMRKVAKESLASYGDNLASLKLLLASGEITQEEFERRLYLMAVVTARDAELASALTRMSLAPRTTALNMIRDEAPMVYAENANFATFIIEKAVKLDTAFTLVDTQTAKLLLDKAPNLLPKPSTPKDTVWHVQKFTSAITQSVLTGESVDRAAARIASVVNMDSVAAMRSARTALTAAENMGRQESYERAEQIGIKGVKVWVATIDDRTRESHVQLDGERVGIHERFPNGLDEPGDPSGDPSEVYNCRCTMRLEVEGVEQEAVERFSRLPEGVSYEDWKRGRR